MNWRRPAGDVMPRVSRASISGRETGARPISVRIAGSTNTSKEMYDDTELPGSVTIGTFVSGGPSPSSPKPCGLPGCIATGPNHTPSRRSASFTTSKSPWETPPDVTTRSASASVPRSVSRNASGSSRTMPTRCGTPPAWVTAAASM